MLKYGFAARPCTELRLLAYFALMSVVASWL